MDEGGGGGDVDFVDNEVVRNTSTGQGAGLYFLYGAPWIVGNLVERNVSATEGGGVRVKLAQATLTDNVFRRNRAGSSGGGLKVSHEAVTLSGNRFEANRAGRSGGGAYLYESASWLSHETFVGNRAGSGGGLDVEAGWGPVTIEDSTFDDGVARADGGHLRVDLPGQALVLRRVALRGGSAERGGALFAEDTTVTVLNSLLEGNVATVSGGAAFLLRSGGDLVNDVAIANEAPSGAALFVDEAPGLRIVNTVFADQVGGPTVEVGVGRAPELTYDDVVGNPADAGWLAGVVGTGGNVAVAPGFVDAPGGDFTLDPTSPLVNTGDPAVADGDETRSDLGLYGGPDAR